MANNLTDEQKRRNRVIHYVTSKKNYLDKEDHRCIKDGFLEKFILCEIPTKAALSYYYAQKGEAKEVDSVEMAYTIIKAALKVFGYEPNDDVLKKYLSQTKKGVRDLQEI